MRLDSNTSLKELEKRTKISKKNLQAVEECRFDELQHPALYQKNFIKKYVEALDQNPQPFLEQFTFVLCFLREDGLGNVSQ